MSYVDGEQESRNTESKKLHNIHQDENMQESLIDGETECLSNS